MIKSRNIIAIPPGATIKEQLNNRGMSQKELAGRMDMSEKHISKLINGEVQLTPEVAMRLEMVLGLPAHFWNNLESLYREKIALAEEENNMNFDIEFVKKLPYKQMALNKWVPDTKKAEERVIYSRKFFEVARLALLKDELLPRIACRRQAITEKSDYALIAWAQKAKIEARAIDTSPINIKGISEILCDIRAMTTLKPEIFCPLIIEKLARCGVAVIFLPHIGGSFLNGATFCDKNKIVVGLTVRGKDADKFWFSMFHELGHILLGHINQPNGTTSEEEKEADKFAQNTLISPSDFNQFTKARSFTKTSIEEFAKTINIDPGIVVGRLQKEGFINYDRFNSLKTQYTIQ